MARTKIPDDIKAYNDAQTKAYEPICRELAVALSTGLPKATSKVWHGGPVWFIDENPVAGYWKRKESLQLLFWSGRSFDEPTLKNEGKFKAAAAYVTPDAALNPKDLKRWLKKALTIQWDYKNIVKRRGVLKKLGTW